MSNRTVNKVSDNTPITTSRLRFAEPSREVDRRIGGRASGFGQAIHRLLDNPLSRGRCEQAFVYLGRQGAPEQVSHARL